MRRPLESVPGRADPTGPGDAADLRPQGFWKSLPPVAHGDEAGTALNLIGPTAESNRAAAPVVGQFASP